MADDTHRVPGTSQFQFNFGADTSGSMMGMGSTYYHYPSSYGYYGPCLGSQVLNHSPSQVQLLAPIQLLISHMNRRYKILFSI